MGRRVVSRWRRSSLLLTVALLGQGRAPAQEPDLAARLRAHVTYLSEQIGERHFARYDHLQQAADYVDSALRSAGRQVTRQRYLVRGRPVDNVLSADLAHDRSRGVIVFGAHYDTTAGPESNPGADDNASGVAVLLELARLLRDQPTPVAIDCVAFANEELPWNSTEAQGSLVYARRAKADGVRLRAVLNLDLVGRYTARLRYAVLGADESSRALGDQVERLLGGAGLMPTRRVPLGDGALRATDSAVFWDEGVPSVFICGPGFWLSDDVHRPTDTAEKLSYPDMALLVRSLVAVAQGLAREPAAERSSGVG